MKLTLKTQTSSSITFTYDKPSPATEGYVYFADGKQVSRTLRPDDLDVTFQKVASGKYAVEAIDFTTLARAEYPEVVVEPPPGPDPPPDPDPDPDPPPTGGLLELSGTISASQFVQQVNAAPAGELTVRGKSGQIYTVTGDIKFTRQKVTIQKATLTGVLYFDGAHGLVVEDSTLFGFEVTSGANDWTIQRCLIDGKSNRDNNVVYRCRNWKLLNNRLQNIHYGPSESTHSEALYIGTDNDGFLIDGNTFYDNGTTGHIFFTWFSGTATDTSRYPRNGCLRNNTYERSHNKYHAIDIRNETQFRAIRTIHIDPKTNINKDAGKELTPNGDWQTPCP